MTDEQILDEIKNGNDSVFRELILRYENKVAATVFGMLGNCAEAEDVGQNVFVRFYNSIDKFRRDSSVGTYLTRIAINLSLNELKRRKRRGLFFKSQTSDELKIADSQLENGYDDKEEIVQAAIQTLDAKHRSVVVLRFIDGYSTKETANILKIPQGTVLSRLARAHKKLRDILSPVIFETID